MEKNNADMSLIEKLAKVRQMTNAISKSKKGFNYSYADIVEILAKVTAGMNKYNISLIPSIVPGTSTRDTEVISSTKRDKTGKPFTETTTEVRVGADMLFKWVNNDRPDEVIEVPWAMVGQQRDPSQAFGSGLTYCTRYFMCNYFQIALPDTDVDAYRSKQKNAALEEDRMIAGEIIKEVDEKITTYIYNHPDKSGDVQKFVGKYAKNANYKAITNPEIASKLLEDLTEKFKED